MVLKFTSLRPVFDIALLSFGRFLKWRRQLDSYWSFAKSAWGFTDFYDKERKGDLRINCQGMPLC